MSARRAREIMQKLKWGQDVSASETEFIRNEIRNPTTDSDIYNLARAFALTNDPAEGNVSELLKFWNEDVDDYNRSGVIAAICGRNGWGLAYDYIDKLLAEANVEKFIDNDTSCFASFSALGFYLNKSQDKNVYKTLLDTIIQVSKKMESDPEEEDRLELYMESVIEAVDEGVRGKKAYLSPIKYKENNAELQDLLNEVRRRISL